MTATKKIAVTGAGGQLGSEIKVLSEHLSGLEFDFLTVDHLDITHAEMVKTVIESKKWDVVINCAAYTAVDKAETEKQKAFEVNENGASLLSKHCAEKQVKLIHISTDFVFDGNQNTPYSETDQPNPLSVYGASKLAGEQAITQHNADALILRTSWLYSGFSQNFLKTMIRLGKEKKQLNVVFDQLGTPTYAAELAKVLIYILKQDSEKGMQGIYHFSNEGVCSWYDFAWKIMRHFKLNCKILPIRSEEYPTPAQRPAYSVLDKKKIKSFLGISIPHWEESLYHCSENLK